MKIETATIRRLRDSLLQSGRRPSAILTPAYETLTRQSLLSPEEMSALTRVDPLAETMFLMMAADDKVTDVERDAVRGAVRGLTDNTLRSGTINVMLETYERRLKEQGRNARLQEIADEIAEEPSEAEGAFALAAAIALADNEVADSENEFINQLAEWFGISEQRASEILDQLDEDRAADEDDEG
jgi:tellurite resistance protein